MKKIYFAALFILILGVGSSVKAQFNITHYTTSNCALSSNYIQGGIAVDTNNNKWFGTDNGVVKFDGTTWHTYTTSDGLPDNYIECIAVDKNNNIWIGTGNDGMGIAKFNGTTWTTFTQHSTNNNVDSLCSNSIYFIAGDIDGSVWFGSWGSGVTKFNGTTWTTYASQLPVDGTSPAAVNYIKIDPFGNKWFGTSAGLSKFNNSTWTTINKTVVDSLLDNGILSIAIDANDHKWLGTLYGVTELSNTNTFITNYRKAEGLYNNAIMDLDINSHGNLWFGCFTNYNHDGGITMYDGITWTSEQVLLPDSVSTNRIFRLAVDDNNDVWITLDYGIYKISDPSGIAESAANSAIGLFPNPATDYLYIRTTSSENASPLEVYNISGQKIDEYMLSKGQNLLSVSLKKYIGGLYFIKSGGFTEKFIVNK